MLKRLVVVLWLLVLPHMAAADESWTVVQVSGTVLDGVQHPAIAQGRDASQAQRTFTGMVGDARVTFDIGRVRSIDVLEQGRALDVQFRDGTRAHVHLDPSLGSLTGQWQGGTMIVDVSRLRRFSLRESRYIPRAWPLDIHRESPPIRG